MYTFKDYKYYRFTAYINIHSETRYSAVLGHFLHVIRS